MIGRAYNRVAWYYEITFPALYISSLLLFNHHSLQLIFHFFCVSNDDDNSKGNSKRFHLFFLFVSLTLSNYMCMRLFTLFWFLIIDNRQREKEETVTQNALKKSYPALFAVA